MVISVDQNGVILVNGIQNYPVELLGAFEELREFTRDSPVVQVVPADTCTRIVVYICNIYIYICTHICTLEEAVLV